MEKYGGRKFLFGVAVVLIATAFVFIKVLPVEKWVELVEIVGATYIVGNTMSKFVQK